MSCDWCERPVGASHAVTCPLKGYVTEPAAPSEGGTGDEIAKLRAEIARLRKTADGQIRSRVAEDIAVESAWERCGITPHWPDDEAGSIVSHAESMAMEIARLREERRWIPVGERLPEHGDSVWVFDGTDVVIGEYWGTWQSYGASCDGEGLNSETLLGITHWTEIRKPSPPLPNANRLAD